MDKDLQPGQTSLDRLVRPEHIRIHPDYNKNTRENDLALISVLNVLPFDFVKEPIQRAPILASIKYKANEAVACDVAGWGQTVPRLTLKDKLRDKRAEIEKRWQGSPYLQVVQVPIWSHARCKEAHNDTLPFFLKSVKGEKVIFDTNICAGGGAQGGDLCDVIIHILSLSVIVS